MIYEQGQVVAVHSGQVTVAVVQSSACQSCKARHGCGQAALSQWGDRERQTAKNHFLIPFTGDIQVGNRVTLAIAEDKLTLAAFWLYLWPLFAAFTGLILASLAQLAEGAQLMAALAAGAAAIYGTRTRFNQTEQGWAPRIVEIQAETPDLVARA